MRIAVTGGAGRLGGYVVQALAPHEVRVLDSAAPAQAPAHYHAADLRNLDALCAGLRDVRWSCISPGSTDRSPPTMR
ncbi:MAG: NAD-dependent epimerase/dehydratase family protein [Acetobacteraceae bacterium]